MVAAKQKIKLTDWNSLVRAAECLRVLSHPMRLRMVELMLEGRYTVGEIAKSCRVRSHIASEHLRLMERCGLLRREREGRRTFYRAAESHLSKIMSCVRSRFGGKR